MTGSLKGKCLFNGIRMPSQEITLLRAFRKLPFDERSILVELACMSAEQCQKELNSTLKLIEELELLDKKA